MAKDYKTFATSLPIVLIERLKLAAVASGHPIQELVADALECSLPRQRVVADEPPAASPQRRAKLV